MCCSDSGKGEPGLGFNTVQSRYYNNRLLGSGSQGETTNKSAFSLLSSLSLFFAAQKFFAAAISEMLALWFGKIALTGFCFNWDATGSASSKLHTWAAQQKVVARPVFDQALIST